MDSTLLILAARCLTRFRMLRVRSVVSPAINQAEAWMAEFKVPVVIEVIGEFEELATKKTDAPTAISMLD